MDYLYPCYGSSADTKFLNPKPVGNSGLDSTTTSNRRPL